MAEKVWKKSCLNTFLKSKIYSNNRFIYLNHIYNTVVAPQSLFYVLHEINWIMKMVMSVIKNYSKSLVNIFFWWEN